VNQPLPIDSVLPEAIASIRRASALVLTAPPGSGKTTRLPAALLDALPSGEVVVLEPRRLAARSAARRVAAERGSSLGEEVGYRVRHDERTSAKTRLTFVTEGILVRRLCEDAFLDGVAAVVLDEFHERHVDTDLALSMLREVRDTVRDDLVVVVMSATLDPEPIAAFLGGCPILRADGSLHDVEIRHLDRPLGPRDRLEDAVRRGVSDALGDTSGDVLVFLPGVGEIQRVGRALVDLARREGCEVLPLHGALPAEEQDRAVLPRPGRKVVLATNVAESSVTIEGVTAVVDTGLARVLRHDPGRGLDALRVERISLASATQRAGRAGRTSAGICIRLWTAAEERSLPAFDTPEIRRSDLAGVALTVRSFAARDPSEFGWFDAPETQALRRSDALLERLGAVDVGGRVTAMGREMLRMPVHPRLARALVEARRRGCTRDVAALAAMLGERDLMRRPGPGEPAVTVDVLERLERLRRVEQAGLDEASCRAQGIDRTAARAIVRARDQLTRGKRGDRERADDDVVRCLLAGFVDRVVLPSGGDAMVGTMVGGRGVEWDRDALHEVPELLLALDVGDSGARQSSTRSRLRLAAPLERSWLEGLVPGQPKIEDAAVFESEAGRLAGLRRTSFLGLVLDERRTGSVDPVAAEAALAAELEADPWRWLEGDGELRALQARLGFLRSRFAEVDWPAVDDAGIVAAAVSLLAGRRSLRDLSGSQVAQLLVACWPAEPRRLLGAEAPERITLSSGRRFRIDYTSGEEPFLAVRIQELFGTDLSPCVGRRPVLLHLLGPNQRPVQVTRDLASFWDNVYPKVRVELRRRYPRHPWPEDPRTAKPPEPSSRRRR
jgi:ATP-dependent helicase HrpB